MFDTFLKTLGAALELWGDKEKNKYRDKFLSLQKGYYEEYSKEPQLRSDAVLDNIQFELRILALAFTASIGRPNT